MTVRYLITLDRPAHIHSIRIILT